MRNCSDREFTSVVSEVAAVAVALSSWAVVARASVAVAEPDFNASSA